LIFFILSITLILSHFYSWTGKWGNLYILFELIKWIFVDKKLNAATIKKRDLD